VNPFDAYREIWAPRVNEALALALPPEDRPPVTVHRAMRGAVLDGGKRVRPVLCLLSARASGGEEAEAMPAALAVEMVHAFSLVHDDLPSMDDDDLRRGKPTCHVVFGEGLAVLCGDALLDHAFATLTELPRVEAVPAAVRALAEAVGTDGLIGGQVEDLAAQGDPPDRERVEWIHRRKTAALFRACARLGSLAAGAAPEVSEALDRFAELSGLAFQIVDDVLDETIPAEELGKTAGKDRAAGKMTYPAAFGLAASMEKARELAGLARESVADLPAGEILAGLADRIIERTH
jgi:geranylgeranyl pyrophosphate synthase